MFRTIDDAIERFDALPVEDKENPNNPWAVLAMAEMALADIEVSQRKGYLKKAREMVFAVMDGRRGAKKI